MMEPADRDHLKGTIRDVIAASGRSKKSRKKFKKRVGLAITRSTYGDEKVKAVETIRSIGNINKLIDVLWDEVCRELKHD